MAFRTAAEVWNKALSCAEGPAVHTWVRSRTGKSVPTNGNDETCHFDSAQEERRTVCNDVRSSGGTTAVRLYQPATETWHETRPVLAPSWSDITIQKCVYCSNVCIRLKWSFWNSTPQHRQTWRCVAVWWNSRYCRSSAATAVNALRTNYNLLPSHSTLQFGFRPV